MDDSGRGIFQSIRFWQGWALAATAAALFTFIANAEFPVAGHTPDYVALIGDPNAPLWVVNADLREGTVNIRSARAKPAPDGQRYTLWLVAGESTQRLGDLPVHQGENTVRLEATVQAVLGHRRTLGVAAESIAAPADEAPSSTAQGELPEWEWQANLARL